jgi:3-isopropylmalate/(R)-2-methylmalate dehydratase small subunit
MKNFGGRVLFLDRADINTDEIIPAKYLTEIAREALQPYLLEGLKLDGFDPQRDIPGKQVVISRANFGCGSSREHAPWALEVNGIRLVIAESFARIFRQNMFNCGLLVVELPRDTIARLFTDYARRCGAGRDPHPGRREGGGDPLHTFRLRPPAGRGRRVAGICRRPLLSGC